MPQRRKTPFSGKAKKQQLQAKKQNKNHLLLSGSSQYPSGSDVTSINYQPNSRGDRNRFALKFYRENDEQLRAKKEEAFKALVPVSPSELEMDPTQYFPPQLTFPQRPPWDRSMTPAQLDAQEHRYFTEYISNLEKSDLWPCISYFELNLETWRQLWRVLEMCDVLLLVTDIRYTGCMFPPSLYNYIKANNKRMILVLNKVDLVPSSAVVAWREYYLERYPELEIVYFTSCPGYNLRAGGNQNKDGLQIRRRLGRQRMSKEGSLQLYEACQRIVNNEVDLTSWRDKILNEGDIDTEDATEVGETVVQAPDTSYYTHIRYKDATLTVGCVGQPNVGKSSLINAVMGKKVVSVSKTPGHTKHFQTIYLTPNVRLCDCPGLVFPSTVPRPIQILMGSYPIAQLREPYSAIRYISERLDLPSLLHLQHPDNDATYSPRDICDAWAKKRGYLTAKAARLDTYRAANSLLRMALDGKICMWLRPPHYTQNKDKFENSEEAKHVKWVQALSSEIKDGGQDGGGSSDQSESSDDDEEESDDDDEVTTAMANKFAALAGGDD